MNNKAKTPKALAKANTCIGNVTMQPVPKTREEAAAYEESLCVATIAANLGITDLKAAEITALYKALAKLNSVFGLTNHRAQFTITGIPYSHNSDKGMALVSPDGISHLAIGTTNIKVTLARLITLAQVEQAKKAARDKRKPTFSAGNKNYPVSNHTHNKKGYLSNV